MLVLIHVMIAISSLVYTGYLYLFPSKSRFIPVYWLIGGTLASGTIVTIVKSAHLLSVCMSGLVYLGLVAAGLLMAQRKLAKQSTDSS